MRCTGAFLAVLCALLALAALPVRAEFEWMLHDSPSCPSFVSSVTCLSPKSCFLLGSFDTGEARLFFSSDKDTWTPVKSAPVLTTGLLSSHPAGALMIASTDPKAPGAFVCAVDNAVTEAVGSFAPSFGVSVLCVPIDVDGAAMSVRRMPSFAKSPYMFAVVTRPPYVPPSAAPITGGSSGKIVLVSNGDSFAIDLPHQDTGVVATHAFPVSQTKWALLTATDYSTLSSSLTAAEIGKQFASAGKKVGTDAIEFMNITSSSPASKNKNGGPSFVLSISEDGGKTWTPRATYEDAYASDLDCVPTPAETCFVSFSRREAGIGHVFDVKTSKSELRLEFHAKSPYVAGVRILDGTDNLVGLSGGIADTTPNAISFKSSDMGRTWYARSRLGMMPYISIEMDDAQSAGVAVGFTWTYTPGIFFYEEVEDDSKA